MPTGSHLASGLAQGTHPQEPNLGPKPRFQGQKPTLLRSVLVAFPWLRAWPITWSIDIFWIYWVGRCLCYSTEGDTQSPGQALTLLSEGGQSFIGGALSDGVLDFACLEQKHNPRPN